MFHKYVCLVCSFRFAALADLADLALADQSQKRLWSGRGFGQFWVGHLNISESERYNENE